MADGTRVLLNRAGVRLTSRLPWIVTNADRRVNEATRRSIARIETGAKARSRVKTGNMRGAWQSEMVSKHSGRVFNLVHYTIYHEMGTTRMSPQPMLMPALEEDFPIFQKEVAEAYR